MPQRPPAWCHVLLIVAVLMVIPQERWTCYDAHLTDEKTESGAETGPLSQSLPGAKVGVSPGLSPATRVGFPYT